METLGPVGSQVISAVNQYARRARGVDMISLTTSSGTTLSFPVYDGHGNMTACLLRDGAGGFTLTSRRAYDPWGAMRQGGLIDGAG